MSDSANSCKVMQFFDVAPWSTSLKLVSSIGVVILVGTSVVLFRTIPHAARAHFAGTFGSYFLFVPLLILFFAILFVIKGYSVDAGNLYIRRLFWNTSISLDGLDKAWFDPSAMRESLRLFGNGGLLSITGIFQNTALGRYRAFITDTKYAVVLRSQSRVVVLSPANTAAFLEHLKTVFPQATIVKLREKYENPL
jgi:hypothetical protein